MNQDEIIEMARRARLHRNQHNLASNPVQYKFSYDGTEEALIAFAKLVAAKEREACAKVCECIFYAPEPEGCGGDEYYYTKPYLHCAEAIRTRGEA